MKNNNPKYNHVVPQVYLRNFLNPKGLLYFYDREKDKIKEQSPEKTGGINHFYTIEEEDGTKNFEIEKFFAKYVDNNYLKDILQKINKLEHLHSVEKDTLAFFMTFQFLRTNTYRDDIDKLVNYMMKMVLNTHFETPDSTKKAINNYEKETGKKLGISAEDMFKNHKNFDLKVNNIASLQLMFDQFDLLYPIFRSMHRAILVANEETCFITSDNPFSLMDIHPTNGPRGKGIMDKNLIKYFPLTSRTCLTFIPREDFQQSHTMFYQKVDRKVVRSANCLIARNSYRLIISSNKQMLEKVIKSTNIKGMPPHTNTTISGPLGTA